MLHLAKLHDDVPHAVNVNQSGLSITLLQKRIADLKTKITVSEIKVMAMRAALSGVLAE